jgi:hypothetical protein
MKPYKAYEKKLFWKFKIWYGTTGKNGEQSLAMGITSHKDFYRGKHQLCFCLNLVFVYFNVGLEVNM